MAPSTPGALRYPERAPDSQISRGNRNGINLTSTREISSAPDFARKPLLRLFTNNSHLKNLFHLRRSSFESKFQGSSKPKTPTSAIWSPTTTTATSIHFPRTPRYSRDVKSPLASPLSNEATTSEEKLQTITRRELMEVWSHGVYLANDYKNQSARLLFTHLLSRRGIPKHLLPCLSINIGLIMVKEHANFPALHIFHIASKQLYRSSPLTVLSFFAMGVAAWNLAIANETTCEEPLYARVEESLGKAELFFQSALDVLGNNSGIDYTCLGLPFKLERGDLQSNIYACDQAIGIYGETKKARDILQISIFRLPNHALFLPIELRSPSQLFESAFESETTPHLPKSEQFTESLIKCGEGKINTLAQTEMWAEDQLRINSSGENYAYLKDLQEIGTRHADLRANMLSKPAESVIKTSAMKPLPHLPI